MNENIGVLKTEWLLGKDESAPINTTVVKCSICDNSFAVPNDTYDQLVCLTEGNELNYICENCTVVDEASSIVDESDSDEEEDYENDLPMQEDSDQIIKEALGE